MVSTGAGGSAGGSGMEYGENTVAARLSIDIPTEGVQSLREITQEISRFRTEMEAAGRSQGDFIGFFQTMPTIASQAANAFKVYADQLERGIMLQQRLSGGIGKWDVQPGSTPDNFKGMSAGMGRSDGNDINQRVADMDRMREMGTVGERQYLNMHKERGFAQPGDIPASNSANDIAAATERISNRERINQERTGDIPSGTGGGGISGKMSQYGGIAKEIMNEFSAGGGGGGVSGMFQRGIAAAATKMMNARSGGGGGGNMGRPPHTDGSVPSPDSGSSGAVGSDEGGPGGMGLGAIGRGLGGMAGGALGLAGLGLTGFQMAQFMGPRLQNLREMGLVEGGGIKEGAGQEIQARIMALNPFLTNDQSRSIIQSALRDGYSGKEYETVTQFMKQNLIDFGLSVQQTRDMIKKDMVLGGASPESLSAELEREKRQSVLDKNNRISFPDRQAAAANLRGIMEDAGASSATSMSSANQLVDMFSDDQALKGTAADSMASAIGGGANSQAMMLMAAGITPSNDFGEWGEQLAQAGPGAADKALKWAANLAKGNKGVFYKILTQQLGYNISQSQANQMLQKIMGGGNELARVQQRYSGGDSGGGATEDIQQRSSAEIAIASGSRTTALLGSMSDLVSGNWENIPQRWRSDSWNEQENHIPILDKLVESQGGDPNKILVEDGSGGWSKLQAGNRAQLDALASGSKWKRVGDDQGYTLGQTASAMNTNFGKPQEVQVQGAVQIHVSTDQGVKVTNAPNMIRLTQNQMNANAGWGNSAMNSPPPGDR